MIIIWIITFAIFCISLYNIWGWSFSRSAFWQGLLKDYACTRAEFKNVSSLVGNGGRFVFFFNGSWKNNDYLDVKVDHENIYIGVIFPFSFSVVPLKIPKKCCDDEGGHQFLFRNRKVYSIPCSDSSPRKVALLKFA